MRRQVSLRGWIEANPPNQPSLTFIVYTQLLQLLKRVETEDDAVRADRASSGGGAGPSSSSSAADSDRPPAGETERTAFLLALAFPDRVGMAKGNSQQEGRRALVALGSQLPAHVSKILPLPLSSQSPTLDDISP